MNKKVKTIIKNLVIISIFSWIFCIPALADKVTLVGEVNDNQEIVTDGQIYTVGDSKVGDDLVENYISQKVRVVGRVEEGEEGEIIIVESFEVVEE
ncbi:MAG: hypothetical protein PVF37_00495 [Desulfobacterales bacterium]|jgi:hypothetical protein